MASVDVGVMVVTVVGTVIGHSLRVWRVSQV